MKPYKTVLFTFIDNWMKKVYNGLKVEFSAEITVSTCPNYKNVIFEMMCNFVQINFICGHILGISGDVYIYFSTTPNLG